jgi:Fe(3+) dicitrate transport protein
MEDGVLFGPAPYSAPAAYYFPLMARMVSVEAFKGASAIRFGPQTIGGALDLRTRGVPDKGRLGAVDGSFGNTFYTKLHAYAGYGFDHGGFLAEGASISSTGFKELDGGGDTGFSKQEFMLKGSVHSDPDAHVYHRLDAKLGYAREDSQETYLGLSDADFRADPLRRYRASALDGMDYWRSEGELFHTLGVGEHFELKTALYRHDFSRVWDRVDGLIDYRFGQAPALFDVLQNPEAYQQEYDVLRGAVDSETAGTGVLAASNKRIFISEGVQTVGQYDFVTGPVAHQLELGLRLHHDQIKRRHRAQGYEMEVGRDERGDLVPGLLQLDSDNRDYAPLAKNKVSTIAVAAHLVYQVAYKGLTLSPGVRAEIIRATYTEQNAGAKHEIGHEIHAKNQTFLFALGALYELTSTVSLLAGVQQGMTPVAPDPSTKNDDPERATNYEAGVRFHDAYGSASAIGFLSDYDKVVAPCDGENCGSGTSETFASGKALVVGFEFGADYSLLLPLRLELPLRAAYTYTHAEFREEFDTTYPIWGGADGLVEAGDEMPYIPAHQWSAGSGILYREKMGVDVQLTFLDRMREEAGQGELATGKYTDRYALLDAALFYQVLARLRIYVKGDNLTNNQPIVARRPFGARPNRPLLVQVGFRWEL